MIINNAIVQLYNDKYHQLNLKYNDLFSKIDQAESDSMLLADKTLEKAMIRGPRQSDVSYDRAVALATTRYNKINLKITEHFQKLRDTVLADQLKKTTIVDVSYDRLTLRADRELIKNEKQSASTALMSFTADISSIKMDY